MKRLRWQIIIVIVALAAIALLLFSQQSTNPQTVIVPEPVAGGIYTEALIGSPGRFNPTLDFYNPVDRDVDRLIFNGLIKFDDRGNPQADIAESWGISRDGTTYNFALRPNAFWHDGQPVISDDVIFTFELLRNPDFPVPDDLWKLWSAIDVKRLDDKTLQFKLPEPFSPFLDYLTFGILPKHLLVGLNPKTLVDDPFNLAPVGSGPYRFERLLVNTQGTSGPIITGVVLTANENYYHKRPFIDEIIFMYYPDAKSALVDYREGRIQGISHITPETLPEALVEPNLNLYTSRLPELSLILLNLDDPEVPFFQEVEVRRALMMGINRQWIINNLLDGQAILASGPIFPGTWAYYNGIQQIFYDPEKAIELLKSAKYTIPASGGSIRAKEDQFISFELLFPDDEKHALMAQTIQENWLRLGVDVTLKAVPYDELLTSYLEPRNYEAALVELNLSRSPDPDPYPFWHQAQITGGQNYSKWEDRQASEYLEQARITVDQGERGRLYRNFQVRFVNELPALPLFYPVYTYAVDAQVRGARIGPLFDPSDRFLTIYDWYLVARGKIAEAATKTPSP